MADPFKPKFVDLVRNFTTTAGTGNIALGAAVAGHSSLAGSVAVGERCFYCIMGVDKPAEREVGRGTMTSNGTIARDPISGALTSFTSGTKTIALVVGAEWFRTVAGWINGGSDSLSALATSDKSSLVAALNEVAAAKGSGSGAPSLTFQQAAGAGLGTATVLDTIGYAAAGVGGARYFYDAAVNAAYVSANARVAFLAADGRGFRLDPLQRLAIEMFGGRADWGNLPNDAPLPGVLTGSETDNLPAFNACAAYAKYHFESIYRNGVPPVHFGNGGYYFSAALQPYTRVHVVGVGMDADNFSGTVFRFPANVSGLILNTFNTGDGGSIAWGSRGGSSAGSLFEGLLFLGGGGGDTSKHGCWMRAQANLERCAFINFAGCGTAIIGTISGGSGAALGNVNGWKVENSIYSGNRGDAAFLVQGNDVNAGTAINLQVRDTFGVGILDQSGLGNTYVNPQINGSGEVLDAANGRGRVFFGGKLWKLVVANNAGTQPGANSKIWAYQGTAGAASDYWPAWSSAATYQSGAGILIEGASNASTIAGYYVESLSVNTAWSAAVVIGGNGIPVTGTNGLRTGGGNIGSGLISFNGLGSHRDLTGTNDEAAFGAFHNVAVGIAPGGEAGIIFSHNAEKDVFPVSYQRLFDGNFHYLRGGSTHIWAVSGQATAWSFGRTIPVKDVLLPAQLALGDPDNWNPTDARIVGLMHPAPSSGFHARGEHRLGAFPFAQNPVTLRSCFLDGTPGSWQASASITFKGDTGSRPQALGASDVGVMYLDTQLAASGKPVWWNGAKWVDANGASA